MNMCVNRFVEVLNNEMTNLFYQKGNIWYHRDKIYNISHEKRYKKQGY